MYTMFRKCGNGTLSFKFSKNNNTISEVVSNGGKSAARTQLKVKGEGGV